MLFICIFVVHSSRCNFVCFLNLHLHLDVRISDFTILEEKYMILLFCPRKSYSMVSMGKFNFAILAEKNIFCGFAEKYDFASRKYDFMALEGKAILQVFIRKKYMILRFWLKTHNFTVLTKKYII